MTMTNPFYNKSCHYVYSFPENKICVTVDIIGQIDIYFWVLCREKQSERSLLMESTLLHINYDMYRTLQFAWKNKFTVYLYLVLGVVHVHTMEMDCIEMCLALILYLEFATNMLIIAYSKHELRLDIVLEKGRGDTWYVMSFGLKPIHIVHVNKMPIITVLAIFDGYPSVSVNDERHIETHAN